MEKNNIRVLVVDNWSFQLMDTLSKLGDAGYFNTYPALNCLDALIALRDAKKPYDVLLCSTALDFEELSALLLAASRDHLTAHYSLIGDAHPLDKYQSFFQDIDTPEFRFLGAFEKPLSSSDYGRALARV